MQAPNWVSVESDKIPVCQEHNRLVECYDTEDRWYFPNFLISHHFPV